MSGDQAQPHQPEETAVTSRPARSGAVSGEQRRVRVATVWLDGCSGCHMSFLDLDERLIEIAQRVEMVYTPLIDTKA